jgi:hypothetical protein
MVAANGVTGRPMPIRWVGDCARKPGRRGDCEKFQYPPRVRGEVRDSASSWHFCFFCRQVGDRRSAIGGGIIA